MYTISNEVSVPTRELIECLNDFVEDLLAADEKRDSDRVTAFVGLAGKHDMFTTEDAIKFAMLPLDKTIIDQ